MIGMATCGISIEYLRLGLPFCLRCLYLGLVAQGKMLPSRRTQVPKGVLLRLTASGKVPSRW